MTVLDDLQRVARDFRSKKLPNLVLLIFVSHFVGRKLLNFCKLHGSCHLIMSFDVTLRGGSPRRYQEAFENHEFKHSESPSSLVA